MYTFVSAKVPTRSFGPCDGDSDDDDINGLISIVCKSDNYRDYHDNNHTYLHMFIIMIASRFQHYR